MKLCGLLNAYWETIKVDTKTDNFLDLFMMIQKDNKLINSLSSDDEELHLKKRISLKKKKTAHAYFWAPYFL